MTTEREYQEGQERIRKARQKSQTAPIWIVILILFALVLVLGNSFGDSYSDQLQPRKHQELEN